MKLIFEPNMYLVGRTSVVRAGLDQFLADHGVSSWESDTAVDCQLLPEIAGRLCYMSFDKPRPGGNSAYINRIMDQSHGSVLEHPVWNFILTGVSRSFTHELVRHRAGVGYSQLSQRYVDESVAEYVVPPELTKEVTAAASYVAARRREVSPRTGNLSDFEFVSRAVDCVRDGEWPDPGHDTFMGMRWMRNTLRATQDYTDLVDFLIDNIEREKYDHYRTAHPEIEVGVGSFDHWRTHLTRDERTETRKTARGTARSVLPNATETKILVSANARALRHMIEMRCSRHAEVEARRLFGRVWMVLKSEAPNLFGDYVRVELRDGTFELATPYRKV